MSLHVRARRQISNWLAIATIAGAWCAQGALASSSATKDPLAFKKMEGKDRVVDEAAIESYRAAAKRYAVLAKNSKGTEKEPDILMRYSEALHEAAGVEFRLSRGDQKHQAMYVSTLQESIAPLSRVISAYPKHEGYSRALFLRAKAYQETGNKPYAIADYKFLIQFLGPRGKLPEGVSAYISLNDLLVEAKDFTTANRYLEQLKVRPGEVHYHLVLDRMAWNYFFLGDTAQAIATAKRQLLNGGQSETERALANIAMFYGQAVAMKTEGYSSEKAIPFFRTIQSGKHTAALALQFAYVLRSKTLDREITEFRGHVIRSGMAPLESAEVLQAFLGYYLNRQDYANIGQITGDIGSLVEPIIIQKDATKKLAKLDRQLQEGAESIRKELVSEDPSKRPPGIVKPSELALLSLYQVLLKITPKTDVAKALKIHNNMGELHFRMERFAEAAYHYRNVVALGRSKRNASDEALIRDAELKSVAAGFENIKRLGQIPKNLVAQSPATTKFKPYSPEVSSWLSWVQALESSQGGKRLTMLSTEQQEALERMVFEANRIRYDHGDLNVALNSLVEFTKNYITSKFSMPSAALVVDTYLIAEDWAMANRMATAYLKYENWKGTETYTKFQVAAVDSAFKLVDAAYRSKDAKTTLSRADQYLGSYGDSVHTEDVRAMAANMAMESKDIPGALNYLAPIMENPKSKKEYRIQGYLIRARLAESQFDFARAAMDHKTYLELSAGADPEGEDAIREKIILESWASGDSALMSRSLADKKLCNRETQSQCERIRNWITLKDLGQGPVCVSKSKQILAQSGKHADDSLMIMALRGAEKMKLKDHLELIKKFSHHWKSKPEGDRGLIQFTLMKDAGQALSRSMESIREKVATQARVKANAPSIQARIKLVADSEKTLASLASYPLMRIRIEALERASDLYLDLVHELKELPKSKGLSKADVEAIQAVVDESSKAFLAKAMTYKKQSLAAAMSGKLESEFAQEIVESYQRDFPGEPERKIAAVNAPSFEVSQIPFSSGSESDALKSRFKQSIEKSNWAMTAYLLREAKNKSILNSDGLRVATAVALNAMGAKAEAIETMGTKGQEVSKR